MTNKLNSNLEEYFLKLDFSSIPQERKHTLQPLIEILTHHYNAGETPRLFFICTHNSRRSQFGQSWAAAAAFRAGLKVDVYSGGTEVTAFHTNAVKTLDRAGFSILKNEGSNPVFEVSFSPDRPALRMFSKSFDDASWPSEKMIAVMTCAHASENCPFIPGALVRIPLDYDDPKTHDGTPQAVSGYEACSRQIATEMKFVFDQVNQNLK